MSNRLVRIGVHIINLDAIAACHWEGRRLVVRYLGGGYEMLEGKPARSFWSVVAEDVPVIEYDGPPAPFSPSCDPSPAL
jgi:hypothetical protein